MIEGGEHMVNSDEQMVNSDEQMVNSKEQKFEESKERKFEEGKERKVEEETEASSTKSDDCTHASKHIFVVGALGAGKSTTMSVLYNPTEAATE